MAEVSSNILETEIENGLGYLVVYYKAPQNLVLETAFNLLMNLQSGCGLVETDHPCSTPCQLGKETDKKKPGRGSIIFCSLTLVVS